MVSQLVEVLHRDFYGLTKRSLKYFCHSIMGLKSSMRFCRRLQPNNWNLCHFLQKNREYVNWISVSLNPEAIIIRLSGLRKGRGHSKIISGQ